MLLSDKPFYTVQGEGELTGVPSVFVRTSGCNLRCRWCDTPYASWKPEGKDWTIDEIVSEVLLHPARHCVITGGEPMIAKGIHELAERLSGEGYHLTIETAGTVPPDGIPCDLASLSPKLGNSTPLPGEIEEVWIKRHEDRRLQPEIIRQWIGSYPFQLKFVVSEAPQLAEIQQLLLSLDRSIPACKVLLMAEGVTKEALGSRRDWLLDACKEHGYRFCHRLHIDLFGNTRAT